MGNDDNGRERPGRPTPELLGDRVCRAGRRHRGAGVEGASGAHRHRAHPRQPCGTALPLLLLTRRSRDSAGRLIELVRSLYRGDRVAFEADVRHRMR
ncbi:hypothetical protein B0T44_24015 [Nocardia donostiensis]|uniref:Uncharacterized protein n=1 Tax=Nocardia donostiensis TaxID=1538463 RepID=A0A1V2TIT8_9NOCA|nr:hypothetical protein B0T46_08455 [Nocardia donostiensis]OQS17598.1 hypothetical protein B0T44_24015 [Nocardia donostiensis]